MLRRFPKLTSLLAVWAIAVTVLGLGRPPDDGDDLIAEFRRFYTADRPPTERLQGVLVLKGLDRLTAAQALLPALEDADLAVRQATVDILSAHKSPETAAWLLDDVLTSKKFSKKKMLRANVALVLGGMRSAPAYGALLAMLEEKDAELRLAGITALGRMGNAEAVPTLAALSADGDGTIALASVEALVAIGPAPATEAALLAAMQHPDWRVRAAAIKGVVTLKIKDGVPALIERMKVEDGRLIGDCFQALRTLTLRDFGDDAQAWSEWWERSKANFELPDPKKLEEEEKRLAKLGVHYSKVAPKKPTKSFLGVETKSENILFVIDVSGSMETPFGDPDRLKSTGRTYASLQRLEIVKEELIATINELPETTNFNVLTFASDVTPWKKDMCRANVLNKNNAVSFVRGLKPVGGGSAGFKAQTGLSTKLVEAGGTNTRLALLCALGLPGDVVDVADAASKPPKTPLDTIFFLTDGEPTVGRSVDMNVIRGEVRRVNQYRGVAIHVIYVGEFGGEDFEDLAHENGGIFVAIGG